MDPYSQFSPPRITVVNVNARKMGVWVAVPPPPILKAQIEVILSRGVGRIPGLVQSYASVSVDDGCAQVLCMQRMKELVLSGIAWAPGSSDSLWEWLRVFSRITEKASSISAAINSWPEPKPFPWLANCYCPGISSLTPREATTLVKFQHALALALIERSANQN
jgi:hypothetical protein